MKSILFDRKQHGASFEREFIWMRIYKLP